MADEGLPFPLTRGWLNDKVVAILPRMNDSCAARGIRDFIDVAVLADTLGFTRLEQVWKTCEDVWGFDVIRAEVKAELGEFLATRGLN